MSSFSSPSKKQTITEDDIIARGCPKTPTKKKIKNRSRFYNSDNNNPNAESNNAIASSNTTITNDSNSNNGNNEEDQHYGYDYYNRLTYHCDSHRHHNSPLRIDNDTMSTTTTTATPPTPQNTQISTELQQGRTNFHEDEIYSEIDRYLDVDDIDIEQQTIGNRSSEAFRQQQEPQQQQQQQQQHHHHHHHHQQQQQQQQQQQAYYYSREDYTRRRNIDECSNNDSPNGVDIATKANSRERTQISSILFPFDGVNDDENNAGGNENDDGMGDNRKFNLKPRRLFS